MRMNTSFDIDPVSGGKPILPKSQTSQVPRKPSPERPVRSTFGHTAGLTTVSLQGKQRLPMPVTPRVDMNQPPGQRLNILA